MMRIMNAIKYRLKRLVWYVKTIFLIRKVVSKVREKGNNCLFVDCGSNVGQGYNFFRFFFSIKYFDAVLIEPNPNCAAILRKRYPVSEKLRIIESAAWVKKDKLKFYGLVEDQVGNTSTGASLLANHNSSFYKSEESMAIVVDAFSLSDWLTQESQSYDTIVMKMDIESSEYEVLQDLIDKKTVTHLEHLFIEFHSNYFAEQDRAGYRKLEEKFIEKLNSVGVGVTIWT